MSVALPMMGPLHLGQMQGSNPDLKSDKTLIKSQKSVVTLPAGFTDEVAVLTVENMLRWNHFFKANL